MSNINEQEKHDEMVRETIRNNSVLNFDYLFMNTLSAVIACYGLLANSPAVVIGAMIVAMLLNPLLGMALALVDSSIGLLKTALTTLVVGVSGIMVTAFLIGAIHADMPLTNEIVVRTAPNLLDLMIALAGGAAGAYATIAPRLSAAFVGVAIATALVPPLGVSGILLARGELELAFGAFLLAFTNIVAIQCAASATMWFAGFHKVTGEYTKAGRLVDFLRSNAVSLVLLLVLALVLTANLKSVISKQFFENEVRRILVKEIEVATNFNDLAAVRFEKLPGRLIIRATVRGVAPPTVEQIRAMEAKLPTMANVTTELRIRFVQTAVMNREGLLHGDAETGPQPLEQ